ncbi:hypothetical protein B0T25DRAFT_445040 [Lasiosphaeria hispida]|uniref:Ketopantoate reductase C-terminal domain-containing protein n=1 Tax=Lasiosphaeria hispida TaxID=260671 RepID=A0AAJ0HVY9_9PEZI|nr:hypothetical protein B0T25DRAFT_445040 [Lasiosphaeria hispida]
MQPHDFEQLLTSTLSNGARNDNSRRRSPLVDNTTTWDEGQDDQVDTPAVVNTPTLSHADEIYVLGLDLVGKYITHTLAGCETIPPVRYLIHHNALWHTWNKAGRQFILHRGNKAIVRNRVVGELYSPTDPQFGSMKLIHNLIVTVPAGSVVLALAPLKHRLDHRSTVCLIHDGLGVAEALIDAYFRDPFTRPTFLMGHLSASLAHAEKHEHYAVSEVQAGKLALSLITPYGKAVWQRAAGMDRIIKRHPPNIRTERQTHLLRLLTAMPDLNAHGYPMTDFMWKKLPTVAFRAVADPLATLLSCTFDKLAQIQYARLLMDNMLSEICDVVARLPECREAEKFRRLYLGMDLRKEVFRLLRRQKSADSMMRSRISRGWNTDVEYLTGFFIKRGREQQIKVTALENIMLTVLAKQRIRQARLEQLKSQSGAGKASPSGGGGGGGGQDSGQRQ